MGEEPAPPPAIVVRALTKRFGHLVAVDGISFSVPRGTVFAFVGTNGAGKSTTISCLTTLLEPDDGDIAVLGHDARAEPEPVRAGVGVVFQESILDPLLTVRENLRVRGALYGADADVVRRRIDEVAALIGVADVLGRRYGRMSGGQRRRVDIARALLASPSIVFLDEPTAGLDPAGRALVWATIRSLREHRGLTVFLTTHYMEETEEADRVCVIDHGRIVAEGSPEELRAAHSRSVLRISVRDPAALAAAAASEGCRVEGAPADVVVPDAGCARRILARLGDDVLDFEFRHGTMNDVFLAVTDAAPERAEPAEVPE